MSRLIEIREIKGLGISLLYFSNDEEFGKFLLNYDKERFFIISENRCEDGDLESPEKFLKKDTSIEYGEKEGGN